MKRPLIHAPYKGVHPYFEILRFQDEKPPKDFHFFILTRTRYITGSKINLFFIGLLDSELFKGAAHTLMRQPYPTILSGISPRLTFSIASRIIAYPRLKEARVMPPM